MGTELLLGQIANTNAQAISRALATIGVDVFRHSVVGDNLERAAATITTALERADAVVITGGLGPTPDDLTREAVAEALGVGIERDPDLVDRIRSIFERINYPMPEANLRQADLPVGARPIEPEGTAPGFVIERDRKILFALPGVPWEMDAMLHKTVLPSLRERLGDQVILSRQVIVIGLGESRTHEKIADLVDAQSNPTIAYLAGSGQVRVRISAKAGTESQALGLIAPVEEAIRERLGEDAVIGNEDTLAAAFGALLRERDITVAVAESLTGGLIGAQLTGVQGSGDYFLGSIVSYSTESKRDIVGVDESILAGPGPVSEDAAAALAEGAAKRYGADLGLSATGVAGPAEQDGMPVGTILVGASLAGSTEVRRVQGYGGRENVRGVAVTAALDLGRRMVLRAT